MIVLLQAKYLALAIEVNRYYWHGNHDDYHRFVEFYKTMYDTLKTEYPHVNVFVTFQLEHLYGLGDKVWGYSVDPHWDFLQEYDGKLDILAFTTYPEVEYDNPNHIPENYYRNIKEVVPQNLRNKSIAFVETAWSDIVSQQYQVDFLKRFCALIEGIDVVFVNWVHLHDMEKIPSNPMLRLGLRTWDGAEKSVWNEWLKLRSRKYAKK